MMIFRQLSDRDSSTYTYLLGDKKSRQAVLIDPVFEQVDRDLTLIRELGLTLVYAMETHVHADHVTGSGVLRKRVGCKTVLSSAAGTGCPDILIEDGQALRIGALEIEARHTPGHTNGDVTYVVISSQPPIAFTGDTLLIRGCGRTDFQQGNSASLFSSVHEKIFTLPDDTLVYPAHDYQGHSMSTIGEEKHYNPRLGHGQDSAAFQKTMANLNLEEPKKIGVAVAANLQCGLIQEAIGGREATVSAWAPVVRTEAGVPEVTAGWLREHAGEVRLIDVRAVEELAGPLGALPGIENVPIDGFDSAVAGFSGADPEQAIVVVCRSGRRSGRAAAILEQAGFAHVASLRGGMIAYRADGADKETQRS